MREINEMSEEEEKRLLDNAISEAVEEVDKEDSDLAGKIKERISERVKEFIRTARAEIPFSQHQF